VTGSDAATSVTGELACGSWGSAPPGTLAVVANNPMFAIKRNEYGSSFCKICTTKIIGW
jgi:hypothetical protein